MGRGKTMIKQGEVMRATRGLLAAATAAGIRGDIEVHLDSGVVKLHITGSGPIPATTGNDEANEWDSVQ
jgi:hypothetical protein